MEDMLEATSTPSVHTLRNQFEQSAKRLVMAYTISDSIRNRNRISQNSIYTSVMPLFSIKQERQRLTRDILRERMESGRSGGISSRHSPASGTNIIVVPRSATGNQNCLLPC